MLGLWLGIDRSPLLVTSNWLPNVSNLPIFLRSSRSLQCYTLSISSSSFSSYLVYRNGLSVRRESTHFRHRIQSTIYYILVPFLARNSKGVPLFGHRASQKGIVFLCYFFTEKVLHFILHSTLVIPELLCSLFYQKRLKCIFSHSY